MPNFVQYGKVGKPIVYNTLPAASEDLKGVCGQVEDKIYICDGSNWNLFSNTTLKKLLDATHSARYLFNLYTWCIAFGYVPIIAFGYVPIYVCSFFIISWGTSICCSKSIRTKQSKTWIIQNFN